MIIVYILIALIIIFAVWAIGSYNGFVRLKNTIEEAYSTMDVYLKKRFDLIPNLVNTVKAYAKHEAETLQKTIEARAAAQKTGDTSRIAESENAISGALKSIFALSEAYPDLKANTNFLELQGQLEKTETDIAQARKYYNAVVKKFNTKCESFPASIIASMFRFEKAQMFEVSDAAQRESIKVEF